MKIDNYVDLVVEMITAPVISLEGVRCVTCPICGAVVEANLGWVERHAEKHAPRGAANED